MKHLGYTLILTCLVACASKQTKNPFEGIKPYTQEQTDNAIEYQTNLIEKNDNQEKLNNISAQYNNSIDVLAHPCTHDDWQDFGRPECHTDKDIK